MAPGFTEDFDKNLGCRIDHRGVFDELGRCVHHSVDPRYLFDAIERTEHIANGGQQVDRCGTSGCSCFVVGDVVATSPCVKCSV